MTGPARPRREDGHGDNPTEPILHLQNLGAGYGRREVLRNVSLQIRWGEIVALLGANGAGKTTTLRAISGEIGHRGTLWFRGSEARRISPEKMALLGLGHVPQGRGTFPNLTVEENLRVGTTPRRGLFRRAGGAAADLDKWLRLFPVLAQRMHAKAGSLSGGEQQMLAIARAMMARPHLLLLDEPSLGLAPKIAQELMEKLVELNRTERLTVMLVEQNVRLALRISTSGYVLETGQISLSGSAADLIEDDRVRRAYLGL